MIPENKHGLGPKLNRLWTNIKSRSKVQMIVPLDKSNMLGAGILYGKKAMVSHTTLPVQNLAVQTLTLWQKIFILLILAALIFGFLNQPFFTLVLIVSVLSGIYFLDVLFSLYLVFRSLYKNTELAFSNKRLSHIQEEKLPLYTILCPLYKEARILPHFIAGIEKIDWPKDKLEVLLLLEEDDLDTIQAVKKSNLPNYIKPLIVPLSQPKTKPKACNFGLCHAQGKYLVIFDAEDQPDPLQLKKAYLGFRRSDSKTICLQAKLNYYNPHQNLLTKLFTAEYSLWFDVILTGLQSIDATIPLGGTSNHFKTKILKELQGWDPFNVTEDCDLGIRIFKKGYKTAIIDSTTYEEANSNVHNWLRQRSRWIKGYIQTYFVHMRTPLKFIKKHGIHAFIFQLIIGARISFMLINPFLWLMTLSYFALYQYVGPQIEALYPTPVFYIAVISLVVGNFVYVYNYMIGCAKRSHWSLMKYIYLVPFYWCLASIAAVVAFYQLIVKPHYWEKTIHGFHLNINLPESQEVRPAFN